jgi:hypothetical protein
MLTQLLLLLGLCYQLGGAGKGVTTSLYCQSGGHTLQIFFMEDGNTQAAIDGDFIMVLPERRPKRPDADGWCE